MFGTGVAEQRGGTPPLGGNPPRTQAQEGACPMHVNDSGLDCRRCNKRIACGELFDTVTHQIESVDHHDTPTVQHAETIAVLCADCSETHLALVHAALRIALEPILTRTLS